MRKCSYYNELVYHIAAAAMSVTAASNATDLDKRLAAALAGGAAAVAARAPSGEQAQGGAEKGNLDDDDDLIIEDDCNEGTGNHHYFINSVFYTYMEFRFYFSRVLSRFASLPFTFAREKWHKSLVLFAFAKCPNAINVW